MKVILGGYNVDAGILEELSDSGREDVTPEVISASYARISRDPRSVTTLREEAATEVEKARRSNRTIVFDMGHASIAEHAVFNIDIIGVSRLAVEAIERFRLASFTEKSQRYMRLEKDFVVPREFRKTKHEKEFSKLMERMAKEYEKLYARILDSSEDEYAAKEDARYLMPLAASAQLGMTLNAREAEYMISRLASHPLDELKEFSRRLSEVTRKKTPSLIRYHEPTEYFLNLHSVRSEIADMAGESRKRTQPGVKLVDVTPHADSHLAAGLIFSSADISYVEALIKAKRMSTRGLAELIRKTFSKISPHESVWREFESVHFIYELVVSASCFAQLKRHRMATIITQPYSLSLGISIPPTMRKARVVGAMRKAVAHSEKLYRKLSRVEPEAAQYVLLNAHRRRVLVDINLRELYHFSRLRSDRHAQWEIREISEQMCKLASKSVPLGSMLLGGKDAFEKKRARAGV